MDGLAKVSRNELCSRISRRLITQVSPAVSGKPAYTILSFSLTIYIIPLIYHTCQVRLPELH
jgi:hypothetical protein